MEPSPPPPADSEPPAPGWWRGNDGRWYPPELLPSDTPLNANWWQGPNGQWFPPLFHPNNRAAYENYKPPPPRSPPPVAQIAPERTFVPNLDPEQPNHARHAAAASAPPALQPPAESTIPTPQSDYNTVFEVRWKGGWPGIFTGESQAKALTRSLTHLNGQGWRVSAAVTDRWSFFKRLGMALLAIVTLGFVVHHQNIILVVERIS